MAVSARILYPSHLVVPGVVGGEVCPTRTFVCNYPHSPSNARCNTNFLSEPFGDEVPQPQPPHDTSHPQSLTRSQYKRSLRSQDARKHRQSTRIQRRAQVRRAYRTWISHFPLQQLSCGKGSASRIHNPKPSYGPTPQAPLQGDRQPLNSTEISSKKISTSTSSLPSLFTCRRLRSKIQSFLKMKSTIPQNSKTPNHLT